MKWKALPLAAALATLLASAASAQRAGSLEIAGFGTWHKFDKSVQFKNHIGAGALLGLFVAPNFSIEADASYTKTQFNTIRPGDITYVPIRGRLVAHLPLGATSAFNIGAGYVRARYGKTLNVDDNGATGLVGFRIGGSNIAARIDGVIDYIPSPYNKLDGFVSRNIHYSVRAGLSFLIGKQGPKDTDKDGVTDDLDRCPDTALGTEVDASGCALPKDADHDGVLDDADRCPNTAAGAKVDASGCPAQDSDHDGVLDSVDKCSGTPAGTKVDAVGCPVRIDSDGDGVVDAQDKCEDTAAGTKVDATGCPIDSDKDGVVDAADRCSDTPAGTKVDGSGCPITDSDSDGIADSNDKCPGTPAGMLVGPNGCLVLFAGGKENVVLQGVSFQTGSSRLTLDARKVLDFVAQSLKANPDINVEIQGYTDSQGSDAVNRRLSQARAQSVRAYLVQKGVGADRLTARGYGESNPIADNSTAEGREQNRRVELKKQSP